MAHWKVNEIRLCAMRNVEMHGDASDFYRSALVFYTRHRVNITIYRTVYLHTDKCMCKC